MDVKTEVPVRAALVHTADDCIRECNRVFGAGYGPGSSAVVDGVRVSPTDVWDARQDEIRKRVAVYMPSNYTTVLHHGALFIVGQDRCGWTLDDYVIERLASGGIFPTVESDGSTLRALEPKFFAACGPVCYES